MRTAPAISKMVARMQACRMVRTLEPTEVPKLLATSLAPTPKARRNDTTNPTITIHKTVGSMASIIFESVSVSSSKNRQSFGLARTKANSAKRKQRPGHRMDRIYDSLDRCSNGRLLSSQSNATVQTHPPQNKKQQLAIGHQLRRKHKTQKSHHRISPVEIGCGSFATNSSFAVFFSPKKYSRFITVKYTKSKKSISCSTVGVCVSQELQTTPVINFSLS